MTSKEFGKILQDKLTSEYGVELNVASNQQIYRSLALICRQMMSENHKKFQSKAIGTGTKQVYYLCMEFLMGRSLKMSLFNLGLDEVAKKALADADINLDSIFEEEPDAGLGNGGLGRLAASYLDGGFAVASDIVTRLILPQLAEAEKTHDYKTELQELVQRKKSQQLSYELISETGPDHCKEFIVRVLLNGREVGTGSGTSKKRAEQAAAAQAIVRLFPEQK